MKISCLFIVIFLLGTILWVKNVEKSEWSQVDTCLDHGYCWDYIRNRCEEIDQGFCVKNGLDCNDKGGKWNSEKQYCKFNFN